MNVGAHDGLLQLEHLEDGELLEVEQMHDEFLMAVVVDEVGGHIVVILHTNVVDC